MRIASFALCSVACAAAFSPAVHISRHPAACNSIQRNMFGGAGEGVPNEDNPEEMAKMEQAAKQMGMSIEEYQLALSSRVKLAKDIDAVRVKAGDDKVGIVRDGNNPPKFLEVTITEEGKALGKEGVSDALVSALKTASDDSRKARTDAQKNMMSYIGEEMKKLGK